MHRGRILQEGAPRAVYQRPEQPFVATFLGAANVLTGKAGRNGSITLAGEQSLALAHDAAQGDDVLVIVRPENMRLDLVPDTAAMNLEGHVKRVSYLGSMTEHIVELPDARELRVISASGCEHDIGARVYVGFDAALTRVFRSDADTIV